MKIRMSITLETYYSIEKSFSAIPKISLLFLWVAREFHYFLPLLSLIAEKFIGSSTTKFAKLARRFP